MISKLSSFLYRTINYTQSLEIHFLICGLKTLMILVNNDRLVILLFHFYPTIGTLVHHPRLSTLLGLAVMDVVTLVCKMILQSLLHLILLRLKNNKE